MRILKFLFRAFLFLSFIGVLVGGAAGFFLYQHFSPKLPDVNTLKDVQFQTPLKILSNDGKLIAEYGEKKRIPLTFEQIPPKFVQALRAAEDARFFEHFGIDIKGLSRAAFQLASTGKIKSGGSTITMQVAKNFFLTRERTFERKFSEILLALKIEQSLSKEEIFELYVNKIYLGHRSYGIQAAANVYYGKNIDELTTAQLAMIAGLPKAPSAFNPITNPDRAVERRNWILGRMQQLAFIDTPEYETAINTPVTAKYHTTEIELYAPYVAEMIRKKLYEQYGENLYTDGYTVYSTVMSEMQTAANTAVRDGLLGYVQRHGYRGPEKQHDISDMNQDAIVELLKKEATFADVEPAIVLSYEDQTLSAVRKNGEVITIPWEGIKWAKPFKTVNYAGAMPKKAEQVVSQGDLIRIIYRTDHWELTQIPQVQGALVALTPQTGAIRSLVGGFSFTHNKFNRATQAHRQPGSNLKPFIYAAALENGFTPATVVNDAPIVMNDKGLDDNWRPQNSSRKFYGPTRLRVGLYKSRNLVSIRVLRSLGIGTAINYLGNFGFDKETLPNNLSLSLGSADVTPLELVTSYASFANGGYKVDPFVIDRIENQQSEIISQSNSPQTSPNDTAERPRIIDERTNYLMYSIMQDVITRGTATRARVLERKDLAGKTGTTNDQKDAWFSGYNNQIVATAWVGYDQPTSLGRSEFGGTAALPIWIDFMKAALKDTPEAPLPMPEGITQVRIDPNTGSRAYSGQTSAIFEYFKTENVPSATAVNYSSTEENGDSTEDIF